MFKRTFYILILVASLIAHQCQQDKQNPDDRKFGAEFEAIQNNYSQKLDTTVSGKEKASVLQEKEKALEELLGKYNGKTSSDEAELLKSRLLIEISRFNDANQKLDDLIHKKSKLTADAKMLKVQILISTGEPGEALKLFKTMEPQLKKESHRFLGWLYLSLYSQDLKEIETYSRKFLETPDLPASLSKYKVDIYWNLAAIARQAKDLEKARSMLEKAISAIPPPGGRRQKTRLAMESQLKQLDLIGKAAAPISANTWFNSPPRSLEELKGKVVVIEFWAAWCSECRKILPVLTQQVNKYKNSELVVIGYTKLYGSFPHEIEKSKPRGRKEEIDFLRQYVDQNQLNFPIAVSHEGYNFEDYKVTAVPTTLFIDKNGNIDDIIIGAARPHLIKNHIKKLLEETNGRD